MALEIMNRLRSLATYLIILFLQCVRFIEKLILFKLTGKHEIYRICLPGGHHDVGTLATQVENCLVKSRQLRHEKLQLFTDIKSIDESLLIDLNGENANLDSSGSLCDRELSRKIEMFASNAQYLLHLRNRRIESSLKIIVASKKPPVKISSQDMTLFKRNLKNCLSRIYFVRQMQTIVKSLAKVKYNVDNDSHRSRILNIWKSLLAKNEDDEIDRERLTSAAWSKIGFQGRDPGTDFRGMGLLSLINLEYLACTRFTIARKIIANSMNPTRGYPFAIVGINLTYLMHNLITNGDFNHFYYKDYWRQGVGSLDVNQTNPIECINELYVALYRRFDKFWANSEMESIMEFSLVMTKFVDHIKRLLEQRLFEMR